MEKLKKKHWYKNSYLQTSQTGVLRKNKRNHVHVYEIINFDFVTAGHLKLCLKPQKNE